MGLPGYRPPEETRLSRAPRRARRRGGSRVGRAVVRLTGWQLLRSCARAHSTPCPPLPGELAWDSTPPSPQHTAALAEHGQPQVHSQPNSSNTLASAIAGICCATVTDVLQVDIAGIQTQLW